MCFNCERLRIKSSRVSLTQTGEMIYSIALIATIATVTLSGVQSKGVEDVIRAIPVEVHKTLAAQKDQLTSYNFSQSRITPSYRVFYNVTTLDSFFVDNSSIANKTSASTVSVTFDLVLTDIYLKGVMQVNVNGGPFVPRTADFHSLATGNLTLKVDAYYNLRTKVLIVKNSVKRNGNYINDFYWRDCKPNSNFACSEGEKVLASQNPSVFADEFNTRVHRILFNANGDIVKKLPK